MKPTHPTNHLTWVLWALAALSACVPDATPPTDAGSPATVDSGAADGGPTCEGRVPPATPDSTITGTGSFTGEKSSVPVSSLVSGYATRFRNDKLKNDEFYLYLSVTPNACGLVRAGLYKSRDAVVQISFATVQGTMLDVGDYRLIRAGNKIYPELPTGSCMPTFTGDAAAIGTLTLTELSPRVKGTYSAASTKAPMGSPPTVEVAFDVPYCGLSLGLRPAMCCIP